VTCKKSVQQEEEKQMTEKQSLSFAKIWWVLWSQSNTCLFGLSHFFADFHY